MKLMTYNIYNGAPSTFDRVVDIIVENNPDFLCLNEANGFDLNDNKKLRRFAKLTGFPYSHLEKCGDGDDYHVAVLSKLQFKEIYAIHPMSRAAIIATVDSERGDITICSTHLSPNSEEVRIEESQRILDALADKTQSIVMGDLNSLSGYDPYDSNLVVTFNKGQMRKFTDGKKILFKNMKLFETEGFIDSAVSLAEPFDFTAPTAVNKDAEHSNMRLDYVLLSSSLKQNLKDYAVSKTDGTNQASDHFPVVVELK